MGQGILTREQIAVDDITKNIRDSYGKLIEKIDSTNTVLNKNVELFEKIATAANNDRKSIDQLTAARVSAEKVVNQANANDKQRIESAKQLDKLTKAEIALREKLEQTIKGERDEVIKLQEELRRETREKRESIKATMDQGDAYETLKRDTNAAQLQFKKLAAQHGINSKQADDARRKFEMLDGELREINEGARDGRRDVGRYGDAIRGVRDNTLKWAAGITATIASLKGLFNAANEQDQINKRLKSSFDLTGESLENVSKKVEFLSRAYDTEVNEVIESATVLTNEFGIESEQAFNLIEKGFAKGANVRGEFLEQLKEYSTQFVNVGLSADEAIAVITQQENKGVFSDKGIDAIKEAGIRLTEMPKATIDALAAIGMSGEEIQRQITTGQKTVFEATQEVSREIAKLPPNAKEVGAVLADVFGGAGEDAKGFVLSLGDVSTSLNDLEDNTSDLEKAQQEIIKQFISVKQEVSNFLIPVLQFLAENFNTIVSVGGKVLRFFLIYKTVMKANELLTGKFGTLLKGLVKGFKNLVSGGKSAIATLKGIGKALKGIGFGIALELLIESAAALWDIASGAKAAREALESLERANENAAKNVERIVNKQSELFNKRMKELDIEIRTRIANGEDEKKLAKEKIEREKELASQTVASLKRTRDFKDAALAKTIQDEDRIRKFQAGELGNIQKNKSLWKEYNDLLQKYGGREKAAQMINERINRLTAESVSLNDSINEFQDVLNESTVQGIEQDSDSGSGFTPKTKEIKEQKESVKELDESYKDLEEAIRDLESAQTGSQITEISTDLEKELQKQIDLATEKGNFEKDQFINLIKDKYDLRVRDSEDIRDFEKMKAEREIKDAALLAVELERIEFEHQERLKQIRTEGVNERNEGIKQLDDAQLAYYESQKAKEVEIEKDANEEIFNAFKNIQEAITQVLTTQIDERISELDRMADAEKSNQDYLEALAANGNITAQQSIAASIEAQRELQAEQIRLAKVKQNIEMISAGLKTFTAEIEAGKTPTEALATTLTTTQVLASILGNLNFFAKGTENAPEGWAIGHENGPEIITDKNGKIKSLGEEGGAQWMYLNKGDKVKTAQQSSAILSKFDQIGMGKMISKANDSAGNSFDMMKLDQTLQGMTSKMDKLQTQINVDWQGLAGGMARVNVHTSKGGDKRTERYTIR